MKVKLSAKQNSEIRLKAKEEETEGKSTHSLMDSVVAIEIAQAKADVVPVLRDVSRGAPHIPVHANIVQGVWATQPAKDKTQGYQCKPESNVKLKGSALQTYRPHPGRIWGKRIKGRATPL